MVKYLRNKKKILMSKIEKLKINWEQQLKNDNQFLLYMYKLLFILLSLLSICLAEGSTWTNWNNFAATNKQSVASSFKIPNTPYSFTRYNDTTQSQSSYSVRANQYRYVSTSILFGVACNLYCGPRSFLTTDSSGNLICLRDMSSNFWGAFQGQYDSYCIPDVDKSVVCSAVAGTSLGSVGACNLQAYSTNSAYKNYQCCYNDKNQISGGNPDITTKAVSTNLFNVRNAE